MIALQSPPTGPPADVPPPRASLEPQARQPANRFVCDPCHRAFALAVSRYTATASCELCGAIRGDWGYKAVALTAEHRMDYAAAPARLRLLQRIAEFDADVRRQGGPPVPPGAHLELRPISGRHRA